MQEKLRSDNRVFFLRDDREYMAYKMVIRIHFSFDKNH